jgi:uncharacterized membrane protein
MTMRGAGVGPIRIASLGHALFAVILIAIGIIGLKMGDFTAIWSGYPKALPGRTAVAYLCAVVCLGSGLGLLFRRTASIASQVLLAYLIAWFVLFRGRLIVLAPKSSLTWWACGETAAMMAGAWVLTIWFKGEGGARSRFFTGLTGLRSAQTLYGLALIPFGVAHFTYLQRTASLVPAWLPWHNGWAYFTGGAFIAAGVAIAVGLLPRLAATLSAWQMGLFTIIVWVPILAHGGNAGDWNEFVDSWALTAAGCLVAESYRSTRRDFQTPSSSVAIATP